MRRHTLLHAAALALALPVGLGAAQPAAPAPLPGARVRVHAHATFVGTLLSLDTAALALQRDASRDTVRVPLATIRQLDVSRGRGSGAVRGAAVGAVLGVAAGALMGVAATAEDCPPQVFFCRDHALVPLTPALLGAVGAGLGALRGARHSRDRWAQVPVRPVDIAVVSQRDRGLGVGVSVGF